MMFGAKNSFQLKQGYEKIPDDEPIFILRGQDFLAPQAVEFWCEQAAKLRVDPKKILEGYQVAESMRKWDKRKLPD